MESSKCHELARLVEKLTTSGDKELDAAKIKALKRICRESDDYVEECFHLVWTQLRQEHSEIRLSSFQIIDELFMRSHKFRTFLLENFQSFLELSLEINLDLPLPPPKAAAESLKNLAYQALRRWHEKFSTGYKKLELAFNYLKNCHKVDFNKAEHVSALEQQRQEQTARQKEYINKQRVEKFDAEYSEYHEEMNNCITELRNCLSLLNPSQPIFDVFDPQLFSKTDQSALSTQRINQSANSHEQTDQSESDKTEESNGSNSRSADCRSHGMLSMKASIQVSIDDRITVSECDDNTDLIKHLDELKVLMLMDYLPRVTRWLSLLQRLGGDCDSGPKLKLCIDLKQNLMSSLKLLDKFIIERTYGDGSEDEFTEVPDLSEVEILKHRFNICNNNGGKSSAHCSSQPSTSRSDIPIVPYGLDLEYWENPEDLKVPQQLPNDAARFWASTERETEVNSSMTDLYRSRRIEFAGKFEPVKWTCRAPLPNGTLCMRMDRKKCPFHGEIISRDKAGKPESSAKKPKLVKKLKKPAQAWDDESLLEDIHAATGVDLKRKSRKKKNNLTDIKKSANTTRARLESKVLSRSATKRVASAMDKIDNKAKTERFCHSFNATFAK